MLSNLIYYLWHLLRQLAISRDTFAMLYIQIEATFNTIQNLWFVEI